MKKRSLIGLATGLALSEEKRSLLEPILSNIHVFANKDFSSFFALKLGHFMINTFLKYVIDAQA